MHISFIDWAVIILFFVLMIVIGAWSWFKNKSADDYFVVGGKLSWWLSGISHHVTGYSGAVFVAYAGLAYTHGFSLYVWWAFTIGISILASIRLFPVRWFRLRKNYHIESPLEFVSGRYNLLTQQIMAWSGILLKLFDVGAKWVAIAILMHVFTGMSVFYGVLMAGGVSLLYITIGGLWAVVLTDLAQFIVQISGGLVMFFAVLARLGGWKSIFTVWSELPENNGHLFNSPYTVGFALAFLFINFLSYNGGTWSLATRYISSPDEKATRKAALLSGILYLIWPLFLFFPMWVAPILLPGLNDPTESYGLLTMKLLPSGLIGLVMASMFANTMSMTASDTNTIAAVITRDILPVLSKHIPRQNGKKSLLVARSSTFVFTVMTIIIAFQYKYFGGVLGLIVSWFGALVGPVSVPMLFGLLPAFKHCGSKAAIFSIITGFITFVLTKIFRIDNLALAVGSPVFVSTVVYIGMGLLSKRRKVPDQVNTLIDSLRKEG